MPLIRLESNVPPYISFVGSTVNYGTVASGLFAAFTTLISSDRITKIDNNTVRIDSAGQYKFIIPMQIRSTSTTVVTGNLQIGINGTYTTFTTFVGGADSAFEETIMRHIVTLSVGDLITLRGTTSAAVANFTTTCVTGSFGVAEAGNINCSGTIVRI
jgi:hypothetical protein